MKSLKTKKKVEYYPHEQGLNELTKQMDKMAEYYPHEQGLNVFQTQQKELVLVLSTRTRIEWKILNPKRVFDTYYPHEQGLNEYFLCRCMCIIVLSTRTRIELKHRLWYRGSRYIIHTNKD